jgi:hypothetical protein
MRGGWKSGPHDTTTRGGRANERHERSARGDACGLGVRVGAAGRARHVHDAKASRAVVVPQQWGRRRPDQRGVLDRAENIRATTPATPSITRDAHIASVGRASHACGDVISAQDCFDTGQDTLIEFEVAPNDEAIAWLVQSASGSSTSGPLDCGKPALFTYGDRVLGCVDIQAVGKGGALSEKTQHCVIEPASELSTTKGTAGSPAAKPSTASTPSTKPTGTCNATASRPNRAASYFFLALALAALARRLR